MEIIRTRISWEAPDLGDTAEPPRTRRQHRACFVWWGQHNGSLVKESEECNHIVIRGTF